MQYAPVHSRTLKVAIMIEYLTFKIKNGKTFREVEIPLKDLGVVAIQGKNGAGKSSIWDLLQVMHYTKTSGGHKKDELVRNLNNSEWELEFNKEEKHYRINYARKKHGTDKKAKWKFYVYEDGENITSHNQQTEVPKQLLELIGLSQNEYEGSIHLTQSGQHTLINGKPKDRKDYISNFFGLDERYDHVMEHAKKEQKITKDEIARISAFDHSKATLETEIKDIVVPDITAFQQELQVSSSKITELNNSIQTVNTEFLSAKEYERLSPLAHSVDAPQEKLSSLQDKAGKLSAQVEQQTLVTDYNRKAKANNAKMSELQQRLSPLQVTIEGNFEELNNEYHIIQNNKQRDTQLKPIRDEHTSLPDLQLIDLTEAEKTISDCRLQVSKNQDKLSSMKSGECPTCGHQHTSDDIESTEALVGVHSESLKQWQDYRTSATANNDTCNRKSQLEQMLVGSTEYTDDMEKRRVDLESQLPILTQKTQIERDLLGMSHQEPMEELDTATIKLELLNNQKEQEQLKIIIDALNKCPAAPSRGLQEIQQSLALCMDEASVLETRIDALKAELAVAEEKKYRKDRLQSQIDDLKKELSQLEELKKKEFLWAKMIDAYGPKGLRLIQLNKVMDLLMERLPFFINLLFTDKNIEFYHTCDAGNISIMWKRKDDEGGYAIDVSQMSGGEAKKLAVALVLALASCVPSKKRANILILDEIDGQLDEDGKYLFANELLPALKKDYNSIFIISHSKDVKQADVYDQVWYFTKPERSHYTLIDRRVV